MKYSKSKQRFHLEKVAGLMIGGKIGSRDICKYLDEQGVHLCRSYVLKLMQDAEVIATQREIDIETKADKVEQWQQELRAMVSEFYIKITSKLRDCPTDEPEDLDFLDLDGPADLSG